MAVKNNWINRDLTIGPFNLCNILESYGSNCAHMPAVPYIMHMQHDSLNIKLIEVKPANVVNLLLNVMFSALLFLFRVGFKATEYDAFLLQAFKEHAYVWSNL